MPRIMGSFTEQIQFCIVILHIVSPDICMRIPNTLSGFALGTCVAVARDVGAFRVRPDEAMA